MCLIYMPKGHDLESFLCSLELEEGCLATDGLSDTSNGTTTANESLREELKTDFSMMLQSSETSRPLSRRDMRKPTLDTSMSSAQASRSHANPSVSRASSEPTLTNEICGLIPFASLRLLDPNISSEKTSPVSYQWHLPMPDLFGTWELYLETFPKSGIMYDGVLYQREIAVPPIYGNGSGLWPTPSYKPPGWQHIDIVDKNGNTPEHPNQRFYDKATGRLVQKGLDQVVKMWPTPRAGNPGSRKPGTGGKVLAEEVKWPTPTRDYKDTGDAVINGPVNALLGRVVTPSKKEGALNPDWVEWLMGFPIGWSNIDGNVTGHLSWETDPADIGVMDRITLDKKNRVARLRCLGNAQVPACAITAWNLLSTEDI